MGKRRKTKPTRSKAHSYPRGVFEASSRGFGFVKTPEGDFFVPQSKVRDAMDGDTVEVSPIAVRGARKGHNDRRDEARIVRVIERGHSTLVGRYEVAEPFGIVVPDDPRIRHDVFTQRAANPEIPDGAMVRVRILEYPTRKSAAFGEVVEVLGHSDDAALVIERVIARHNLDTVFSADALAEAAEAKLDVDGAIASGYRDIRDRYVFTIDPSDAKDFDDALSIKEIAPGKYRLGVHIADVSAYVEWASAIDLDARKRATSVYLPDRVIPMLPPALSENLCSLRPGEDRLCMTADLFVDENANLLDYDFYPAVMCSRLRLTYDEALASLVSGGGQAADKLAICSKLAKARQKHRESLGGIEFSTKEAKVKLDDKGVPIGIDIREKNDATELIEEAMIFANEVVATHLFQRDHPCAYRDHESPAVEALARLVPTLQEFKWFTTDDTAAVRTGSPFAIQRVLGECKGRAEEELVTMLMLRAMMRAVYSPQNAGHYGLGLAAYCHFTSPIRRYPDLIVHRMLKHALGLRQPDFGGQTKSLKWLCEHSSDMEREAEAASLDAQKTMMAQYMEQFIGDEFDAIIAGVASYGIYVRLDNCVEGLVHVRSLGDEYFAYNEDRQTLRGVESNTTYRLGQRIHVRLTEIDSQLARIDFKLASHV